MLEVLKAQQLNIMLILCGITGIISLFVVMSKGMSKKRKESLIIIELGSMLLLIFDRYAYIYRGDVSFTGYWMVRISNFMVFFLTIVTVIGFNEYLADLITNEGGQTKVPRRLMVSRCVLLFGILMLIISQFTGLYYTFDATNHYQRSSGYIICYLIPFIALLIQLSVIIKYGQKLNRGVWVSLILFSVMPFVASVAQLFLYGLSLTNIGLMAMGILLYIFALNDMNTTIEKAHRQEVEYLKEQQSSMNRLFDEMARAFAKAIDDNKSKAKGHSERVAKYARMIAEKVGKDEDECERAYYAALLHDVGKIGIPDELIDKVNLLNNEEEKIYQSHTLTGEKILSEVKEYSYLAEVSHFHHERYDGGGYPDKLKGEEIPELARLVAVADAYDNLTSNNEFGEVAPQFAVREEFVKEGGIRFDPDFAKAMVALIGADSEYRLREIEDETESVWKTEINCTSYRSEISNGIIVSENIKKITFKYESNTEDPNAFSQPSLIVYDSLDSRVHSTKQSIINSNYTEYGEIWFDGHTICTVARNIESKITDVAESGIFKKKDHSIQYEIETARYKDHIRIIIKGGEKIVEITVALPDSIRFAYIGITGENAHISGINVEEKQEQLKEGDIKRIAEEVSYIDRMESDIANIQVNGYRTLSTEGVKIFDGMRLEFHTMSLPTANLIWHCPYMVLYHSDDKKINGENYRELVLIRIDGEVEPADDLTDRNKILVTKSDKFEGWDNWKEVNKAGMECVVRFNKKGNKLIVTTDNLGISIKSVLTTDKEMGDIYVSLTGDQVALTDIRVL